MKKIIFIFLFLLISIGYLPTTENKYLLEQKVFHKHQNSNIIGTIKVPNTNIYADLVQEENNTLLTTTTGDEIENNYYLNYQYNGMNYKFKIFGNNLESNYIEEFNNYVDESYYNEHKDIIISIDDRILTYTIFSIVKVDKDDNVYFKNLSYNEQLDYLKNFSIIKIEEDVNDEDNIISIKTSYNNLINGQLLISAKRN